MTLDQYHAAETCACGATFTGPTAHLATWRAEHRHTDPVRHAFSAIALPPDATLVVTLDPELVTDEDVEHVRATLEDVVPGRWLIVCGAGVATPPASSPQEAQEAAERLPWSHWSPELRTRLKALAGRYPVGEVYEVAQALATVGPLPAGDLDNVRELAAELGGLGRRFDPASIAEAALELVRLIDEHGPRAEEHLARLERQETRRR